MLSGAPLSLPGNSPPSLRVRSNYRLCHGVTKVMVKARAGSDLRRSHRRTRAAGGSCTKVRTLHDGTIPPGAKARNKRNPGYPLGPRGMRHEPG